MAVAPLATLWRVPVLRVAFNGPSYPPVDEGLAAFVLALGNQWLQGGRVNLELVREENWAAAEVRIDVWATPNSENTWIGNGNYGEVGPSMAVGFPDLFTAKTPGGTSTILHGWGHALGLAHTSKQPGIQWDMAAVERLTGEPADIIGLWWTDPYQPGQAIANGLDPGTGFGAPGSIMYGFPVTPDLTFGTFQAWQGSQPSALDLELLRRAYPVDNAIRNWFHDLLLHEALDSDVAFFSMAFSRAGALDFLRRSDEAIRRLYQTYLHRDAGPADLAAWRGKSAEVILQGILLSPEYAGRN